MSQRLLVCEKWDGEPLLASEDWVGNELAIFTDVDPHRVIELVRGRLRGLPGQERDDAANCFLLLAGAIGLEEEVRET